MTRPHLSARRVLATAALLLAAAPAARAQAPTVEQFKQTLTAQLLALRSQGYTERQVLFVDVRPGRPSGGRYPFLVTALVRDYGPGYPANGHYGATCVGRMDAWPFEMARDAFDRWRVQRRMTVTEGLVCKDNPAEGVSSMPLAGLPGAPAGAARGAAPNAMPNTAPNATSNATPHAPSTPRPAAGLALGEYACYGAGMRLMAGMGFVLRADGTYRDADGARGGRYALDPRARAVVFRGGFLDGQTGRNVDVRRSSFDLSSTVNCEPWR